MEQLTTEQVNQVLTWTQERDRILADISVAKTELESLQAANRTAVDSTTEATNRMNNVLGRIAILEEVELNKSENISKDIADLVARKAVLEESVSNLSKQVVELEARRKNAESSVRILIDTHEKIFKQASLMEKVVNHVTRVGEQNVVEFNKMVESLKQFLTNSKII